MSTKQTQQYLNVYLHNQLAGRLMYENAVLHFMYDANYLQKEDSQKLSVSLPLEAIEFDHQTTSAFFSGLLPDQSVRTCLAKYLKLSEKKYLVY